MKQSTLLKKPRRATVATAVAAILMVAVSCDDVGTMRTDPIAPSYTVGSHQAGSGNGAIPVKRLVRYQTPVSDMYFSEVIGPRGGKLTVSRSGIYVPRGAVTEDVVFAAHVMPGDTLHFALTATRVSSGEAYGRFEIPVHLKISYEDLQVSNISSLVVTWLVDGRTDGAMVGIPTRVAKANKAVIADLVHFSDYALGEN